MRDVARRDRLAGGLSQLQKVFQKISFLTKGGFSGFLLVSTSLLSAFPALPAIHPEEIVSQEKNEEQSVPLSQPKPEELCLWQKDVSFFDTLDKSGKKSVQKELPCVEQKVAVAEKEKTESVDNDLNTTIQELTAGYPLAAMAPTIAEYDREIAALIVGIAKKESDWGKRVPRTPDGADCYNYWGFKGAGTRGIAMGHGCFGSPEEAVHAIGNRLTQLVELRKTSEPKNMVIWKCGSSCATHSPESVRKWISDVDLYYRKIAGK